jgi:cellulose synthase/poly-beta-1,6-N-acetylglucosamine synthase-like glycosyltransferase
MPALPPLPPLPPAPVLVSIAITSAVAVLFIFGGLAFMALVKGCLVLRRLSRTASLEDTAVLLKSPLVPAAAVITVADECSPEAREFVRRLLDLHFGNHEVILVLDGPGAAAMEAWTREFRLRRSPRSAHRTLPASDVHGVYESSDPLRLLVVHKEKGSEGDSLNAGVNAAAAPVICVVDPESEFEPTLLLRLIRPMLEDPDRTIAVCGVAPPPLVDTQAGRIGALELVRMWLARCAAFDGWGMVVPVPGAGVLVRRDTIVDAGGFFAGRLELILHLHGRARATGKPYRVELVPEPVCRARAPRTLGDLRRLARRDQHDIARAWSFRKRIARGKNAIGWGFRGMVCARFLWPLVETVALTLAVFGLLRGWSDIRLAGAVLLSTAGMGAVLSMAAVVFRELTIYQGSDPGRLVRLFFTAFPENLGYRQMRNFWLLAGFSGRERPKKVRREKAP